MAKLPKAFKPSSHEKMRDFSAIPTALYKLKIADSEYKETASKNGHLLKIIFEVVNGEHKGAKVFVNLNLDNPSDQAVEIAERELATICEAIGMSASTVRDTKVMHGKSLIARVIMTGETGNEKNEVKMYWSLEDKALEEESDGKEEDKSSDATEEEVIKLAKKYKEATSIKSLKKVLKASGISKTSEIEDLNPDDLESLKEDLTEAIEDAE